MKMFYFEVFTRKGELLQAFYQAENVERVIIHARAFGIGRTDEDDMEGADITIYEVPDNAHISAIQLQSIEPAYKESVNWAHIAAEIIAKMDSDA